MFCVWLKKSRRELGLTQRALGRETGLNPSTLGMYEQGRRVPGSAAGFLCPPGPWNATAPPTARAAGGGALFAGAAIGPVYPAAGKVHSPFWTRERKVIGREVLFPAWAFIPLWERRKTPFWRV